MDINDYVFINKKVLKFVGLYPTSVVRYIICCMCMIAIVIPQGMQIYENWQDMSIVLETSSVLFTILLALLKSLVWISNRKKMDPFIEYMLTDYWNVMTYISNKHAHVYEILPIIDIIIAENKDIIGLNSTKHFPFLALYPDSYYNFPMYEIVYLSQMVATSLCGLVILGTDTLIATALFHTCGHFKVLQKKIKNINTNFDVSIHFQKPFIYYKLKYTVGIMLVHTY
ncbi:hypothetical protein PUN28_015591 [Cardiocondyla obscurior]|uniref:Uncharacterized protein n=1 Tax=Cardiocondyla obscurior TaxID=286306 RepID=A0AAW2EXQ6_9HYME